VGLFDLSKLEDLRELGKVSGDPLYVAKCRVSHQVSNAIRSLQNCYNVLDMRCYFSSIQMETGCAFDTHSDRITTLILGIVISDPDTEPAVLEPSRKILTAF
jgi:hypothetical protein